VIVGGDVAAGWVDEGIVDEATEVDPVRRVGATVDGDDGFVDAAGWVEPEHAAATSATAPAAMIGLLRLGR